MLFVGETALHVAVSHNNRAVVKIMIEAGAEVHLCERKRGANSLHLAAHYHHLNIATYLINQVRLIKPLGLN